MAFSKDQLLIAQLKKKGDRFEYALQKIISAVESNSQPDIEYAISYAKCSVNSDALKRMSDSVHFPKILAEMKEHKFVKGEIADRYIQDYNEKHESKKKVYSIVWDNLNKVIEYENNGSAMDDVVDKIRKSYELSKRFPKSIRRNDGVWTIGESKKDVPSAGKYTVNIVFEKG